MKSFLFAAALLFLLPAASAATLILDADTPATGSDLETTPLVTPYGTVTFQGEVRNCTADPDAVAAGATGNGFDIDQPESTAEMSFDFDVSEVTMIYGGNAGVMDIEARDMYGAVVDSFYQASTGNGEAAGPITLYGPGIRSLFWQDSPNNFLCLDNLEIEVAEPIAVAKTYRHTNVCFERDNDGDEEISEDGPDLIDNDGDGLIDEDPSECPDGTNPGDLIANDGEGTYFVDSLIRNNGRVSSYNPGQLYAVTSVMLYQPTPTLVIGEEYADCTMGPDDLLDLNPAKGGGRAIIVVEYPDGTLVQYFDANTDHPDVEFHSDEEYTFVEGYGDFQAGDIIHLYVKFGPGKQSSGDGTCDNFVGAIGLFDGEPFLEGDAATLVVTPKED